MRSVSAKARRGRAAKPSRSRGRVTTAIVRSSPGSNRKGRRRPNVFARVGQGLRAWFSIRHPAMWILCIIVMGVLIAGGFVTRAGNATRNAVNTVVTDAGFGIGAINIAGAKRTDPHDILGALGFAPGQSIFGADIHAARQRLLGLEWVADAEVRRQYPGTITVSVVEKVPFALWETPNGTYLVERSGSTIGLFDPKSFPRLPLIAGDGAPRTAAPLVDAVRAHRAVSARVVGYQRVSDRRWNLLLNGDVIVELPEEDWREQLDVLEHLIVDKGILERDIAEIDLRMHDNYFFVLRNGQKQQMRGNAA
ncbi:MAG TPA: FtsQ-type POTRA domain-containing protein [Rhizomicrobium sp.]|nr:FtsQ-type POTRA domain-containing protein [Rhizomicrobium sp.]